MADFLDTRRLMWGPWQALERDVARLMILTGFEDVRIVGGTGDGGADVLGVINGCLWIVQCKLTTSATPPIKAIEEVMNAGRIYQAQNLAVAVSRPPGERFVEEIRRLQRDGVQISIWDPVELLAQVARVPDYPPNRRSLRPYQVEAKDAVREGLTDTGRALLVLATGLGKSVILAEVTAELFRDEALDNKRVLVLAHTKELVKQLHRTFWFHLPKSIATHQLSDGEFPTYWDGITFATVQSAQARLDSLPSFDLVVIDEAHHAPSATYTGVLDRLRPQMLIGATATPWRMDDSSIEAVFGSAVYSMGIEQGMQNGFLADVDYRLLADNIDWNVVQEQSTMHYSLRQLNTRLILPTRDNEAAKIIQRVRVENAARAIIVFTRSVEHALDMAGTLRLYGMKAEALASSLPPREQDMLMTRFRNGEIDCLCTVDIFNEGVDVPDVDLIVFMRVTHSRRIFVQQLGRGLRLAPGKTRVTILDFVTDLRRMAEVLELDKAMRQNDVERLGLGANVIEFADKSAGSFLREWVLDQTSLLTREGDAGLQIPQFSEAEIQFPMDHQSGTVQ
jgi:superfamily II DNA or RNA helicase